MAHRSESESSRWTPTFNFEGQRLNAAVSHIRSVLGGAGIPDEAYEAKALVRAATGVSNEAILTDRHCSLTREEQLLLETLVARRLKREPLQYIVGSVEFYGREFKVDDRVLIPRPETELLVEQVLAFAGNRGMADPRILDIGTGSGAIAVTLALELPGANIVATDISTDALDVAAENARSAEVDDRIELVHCSLAAEVRGRFDIVVCNPPYVMSAFLAGPEVQPELAHEPRTALDGGDDGMDVYRPLLSSLGNILSPDGAAFIEIDPPVATECLTLAKANLPEASVSVLTDLAGLERCLVIELPH